MSNFQFITTRNYMKRDPSSGSFELQGPATSRYFGNLYITQHIVPHNLGYVPLFRVYYEPYRDGRVMEAFQDTAWFLPSSPNEVRITEVAPTLMSWADSENLYLELNYINSTLSGLTFPIYWVIYQDYGVNA